MKSAALALTLLLSSTLAAPASSTYEALSAREDKIVRDIAHVAHLNLQQRGVTDDTVHQLSDREVVEVLQNLETLKQRDVSEALMRRGSQVQGGNIVCGILDNVTNLLGGLLGGISGTTSAGVVSDVSDDQLLGALTGVLNVAGDTVTTTTGGLLNAVSGLLDGILGSTLNLGTTTSGSSATGSDPTSTSTTVDPLISLGLSLGTDGSSSGSSGGLDLGSLGNLGLNGGTKDNSGSSNGGSSYPDPSDLLGGGSSGSNPGSGSDPNQLLSNLLSSLLASGSSTGSSSLNLPDLDLSSILTGASGATKNDLSQLGLSILGTTLGLDPSKINLKKANLSLIKGLLSGNSCSCSVDKRDVAEPEDVFVTRGEMTVANHKRAANTGSILFTIDSMVAHAAQGIPELKAPSARLGQVVDQIYAIAEKRVSKAKAGKQ